MTTRVLCIRHGETAWNAAGRWQGHAPVPLNDTGLAQSKALGHYLSTRGPRPDAIYSSDLKRAVQTAHGLAAALNLAVQLDARLREVDLGEWQGLTRDEVEAWDPKRFAAYAADRHTVPTPNGESRNMLKVRVRAAFDDLTARHPGQTLALISHGGSLGMLVESLFGHIERPSLANTSITVVTSGAPGTWQLEHVAWSPHLNHAPLGETW